MNYIRGYIVVFVMTLLTAFCVYFWLPDYRPHLLKEDHLIENLSAFFFLATFSMGFLFLLKANRHRKALSIVTALGLIGFLDEISFGERLLRLKMPVLYGVKIDGAHDFFFLVYKNTKHILYAYRNYIALLLVCTVIITTFLLFKHRSILKTLITKIYNQPPFIFSIIFAILLLLAMIIDLEIVHHNILFLLEELFEMNASIALLFCGMSLYAQRDPNQNAGTQDL